jgi:hypothetical protein
MTDTPTLANGGAPASPSPAPAPAPQAAPAPVTPGSKAWAEMSTEQRHAQLRGPDNPRAHGYSPAIEQREAAAARAAGEAPPSGDEQQPPADAGAKVKVGQYEVSEREVGEMMQRQAQEDLRKAKIPAGPEAYEAKLPDGLRLPGGQQYKFDDKDPSLIAARNLACAKGWSQQDFSEALGIFASHIAGQEAQLAERSRAELEKAGVNAPQRVDAVGKWLDGFIGTADAAPIKATLVTNSHLVLFEKLMSRLETQGVGSFSQSHRAAPDAGDIPGYENMSFEQRRFAQDQKMAARTRR